MAYGRSCFASSPASTCLCKKPRVASIRPSQIVAQCSLEDDPMQSFLRLNLQVPDKKPEDMNAPVAVGESQPQADAKKLNRMANRIAHKAAKVYGHGGSGLFSK